MESRKHIVVASHHIPHTTKMVGLAISLALTACGTDQAHPTTPGEHVIYKTVNVEVPKPCPVTKPARPAKLARPLPTDPAALAEALVAKLLEWDGPGGYGERADAALDTCIASTVPTAKPK